MTNFIINQNIKINSSILEIKHNDNVKSSVKKFINQSEPETKKLIMLGSLFFLLFYFLLLFFLPRGLQFDILNKIPMINKVFHFYRKIILASVYEYQGKQN